MAETPPPKKTLVRGADGALYLVSETGPPMKLTEQEKNDVEYLLNDAEEKLAKALNENVPRLALGCTHKVQIEPPEVFMDD
jgi:hypothetical protein